MVLHKWWSHTTDGGLTQIVILRKVRASKGWSRIHFVSDMVAYPKWYHQQMFLKHYFHHIGNMMI